MQDSSSSRRTPATFRRPPASDDTWHPASRSVERAGPPPVGGGGRRTHAPVPSESTDKHGVCATRSVCATILSMAHSTFSLIPSTRSESTSDYGEPLSGFAQHQLVHSFCRSVRISRTPQGRVRKKQPLFCKRQLNFVHAPVEFLQGGPQQEEVVGPNELLEVRQDKGPVPRKYVPQQVGGSPAVFASGLQGNWCSRARSEGDCEARGHNVCRPRNDQLGKSALSPKSRRDKWEPHAVEGRPDIHRHHQQWQPPFVGNRGCVWGGVPNRPASQPEIRSSGLLPEKGRSLL